MKRLVEFPLDEGGSILVQVDEPESGGTVRRARPPQLPKAEASSRPYRPYCPPRSLLRS